MSVVIIFRNAARFLEEAIVSVFAQTYWCWELLLVDDGSTDGSTEIARRYVDKDPHRVRYLDHPAHAHQGMSASRNLGIRDACGEYVAFLDADDVWLPQNLERYVELLNGQPGAAMVYGDTEFWYSWGEGPEDLRRDFVRGVGIEPETLIEPPGLLTMCSPLGAMPSPAMCSLLVRRSAVEQVGRFDTLFRGLFEDQAFLVKMFLTQPIFVSNGCYSRYRRHADSCVSVSITNGTYDVEKRAFLQWLQKYLTEQQVSDTSVWRAYDRVSWRHHHPRLHYWSTRATRLGDQLRVLWHSSRAAMQRFKRSALNRSTGSLSVHPNPIQVYDWLGLGTATLSWTSRGTKSVEVHVGAPDGPLLSRTGPTGEASTGKWVTDWSTFYLQDASDGLPLTSANTLATATVRVLTPEV